MLVIQLAPTVWVAPVHDPHRLATESPLHAPSTRITVWSQGAAPSVPTLPPLTRGALAVRSVRSLPGPVIVRVVPSSPALYGLDLYSLCAGRVRHTRMKVHYRGVVHLRTWLVHPFRPPLVYSPRKYCSETEKRSISVTGLLGLYCSPSASPFSHYGRLEPLQQPGQSTDLDRWSFDRFKNRLGSSLLSTSTFPGTLRREIHRYLASRLDCERRCRCDTVGLYATPLPLNFFYRHCSNSRYISVLHGTASSMPQPSASGPTQSA